MQNRWLAEALDAFLIELIGQKSRIKSGGVERAGYYPSFDQGGAPQHPAWSKLASRIESLRRLAERRGEVDLGERASIALAALADETLARHLLGSPGAESWQPGSLLRDHFATDSRHFDLYRKIEDLLSAPEDVDDGLAEVYSAVLALGYRGSDARPGSTRGISPRAREYRRRLEGRIGPVDSSPGSWVSPRAYEGIACGEAAGKIPGVLPSLWLLAIVLICLTLVFVGGGWFITSDMQRSIESIADRDATRSREP